LIKFKKFADRESKDEKTFTMGGKEEIFLNWKNMSESYLLF
jgi:hypothetical protein